MQWILKSQILAIGEDVDLYLEAGRRLARTTGTNYLLGLGGPQVLDSYRLET